MTNGKSAIQAVVFDLDDTLYPERQYVRSGYRAAAGRLREMTKTEQPFEEWLWQRFLAGKTDRAFDALSEHFQLNLTPEKIAELVAAYRRHRPEIQPYEEIADLLGKLHGSFRLGLLSDGFLPAQKLKYDALEVERFFDAVVFTEEIGRDAWKPSTAGFEAVREKLDVPHAACAYVADNPAKDFVAPNALGWLTVQLLQVGQIHSSKPAPDGGEPRITVDSVNALHAALTAEV